MSNFSESLFVLNSSKGDNDLVRDFLRGSESAFNQLANRYHKKIYWHARKMVGNHEDADEIVQQVFIVMYKKLGSFNFQSSLYTWIYKITSTRSLNLIKKNNIKKFISFGEQGTGKESASEDILHNIEEKERFDKLQLLLQQLPAKQREVFIFRNFDDLSYEEISKITGKSIGALKSNCFHAFKKIKELIREDG